MDEIRAWLNDPQRKYKDGARLYLVHGKDHSLRRVFMEAESPFKFKKLHEALRGLLTQKKQVIEKVVAAKEVAIEHISKSERRWPDNMDPVLKALHTKWKPVFAEMMSLTSRIYEVALQGKTDPAMKEEAGRMAHRILDLDDECDAIYVKRDHYQKYGRLPEDVRPIELVVDPLKMPLALLNSRRYVREYKSKLKKEPDNVNYAKMLEKHQWAVEQYEQKLKLN